MASDPHADDCQTSTKPDAPDPAIGPKKPTEEETKQEYEVPAVPSTSSTTTSPNQSASSTVSPSTSNEQTSPSSSSERYKRLHISNIPFKWRSDDLVKLCKPYGLVCDAEIVFNERGSKGFGFVTFEYAADADACIAALHHHLIDGRKIEVHEATQRKNPKKTVMTPEVAAQYALGGVNDLMSMGMGSTASLQALATVNPGLTPAALAMLQQQLLAQAASGTQPQTPLPHASPADALTMAATLGGASPATDGLGPAMQQQQAMHPKVQLHLAQVQAVNQMRQEVAMGRVSAGAASAPLGSLTSVGAASAPLAARPSYKPAVSAAATQQPGSILVMTANGPMQMQPEQLLMMQQQAAHAQIQQAQLMQALYAQQQQQLLLAQLQSGQPLTAAATQPHPQLAVQQAMMQQMAVMQMMAAAQAQQQQGQMAAASGGRMATNPAIGATQGVRFAPY